ncbi:MAG: sulfotransferase [Halioglobus sp.]|nr:sulfotransferase [Halioglobus sp.]
MLYNLAVARRYGGDCKAALDTLEALVARDPEYGRAHQERGHNLLSLNRPAEAAAAFARAVDLNPGLLASWKALAALYEHAGRGERARAVARRVKELEALPSELRNAMDLLHEGHLRKAEALCRAFLREHRQHAEGMRLLAEIGVRLKIFDDAEFLLESCVEFEPDNAGARSDYLRILNRKGKFRQALEQARELMRLEPDNPVHRLSHANALAGVGRFEEAIEGYRRCLDGAANPAGIHLLLGHALKAVGDVDAAIASYRRAYELRPEYGDAWWSLANTKTYRFDDGELRRMLELQEAEGVARDDRVHLNFAAGKALEDRGDYAAAFTCYERGNALQRRRCGYSPELTARMVDAQMEVCTRELFEARGGCGHGAPDPIFILGMPRAGSTLLEQILASHSQVDGTMELHNILGLAQRLRGRTAAGGAQYPANLREIDPDYFRRFGERFIEDTRDYRAGAPLFIDKMPNNFLHIGLIHLILPRAKVIDARRSPMACCFSNFKQLFGEGQEFSYDLGWMGRYYRDYVRLMAHWDEVLPGFVLRVRHEDVLDDLEGQVRRMLDFCGLEFEEQCLRYYETERAVRTPSSEQVRRPIDRAAAEQWHNFDPWLGPLREALGPELAAAAN